LQQRLYTAVHFKMLFVMCVGDEKTSLKKTNSYPTHDTYLTTVASTYNWVRHLACVEHTRILFVFSCRRTTCSVSGEVKTRVLAGYRKRSRTARLRVLLSITHNKCSAFYSKQK